MNNHTQDFSFLELLRMETMSSNEIRKSCDEVLAENGYIGPQLEKELLIHAVHMIRHMADRQQIPIYSLIQYLDKEKLLAVRSEYRDYDRYTSELSRVFRQAAACCHAHYHPHAGKTVCEHKEECTMKILMITGSLRKESFNRQLAQKAAELLNGRAEVVFLDYADVPFMNQDIESPAPEAVTRVRSEVLSADGLWFFSPEYNHSYTGVLKNLLDWLSRPLEAGNYASGTAIAGKKAAISGAAGMSGAGYSREKLRELLVQIKADVIPEETGVVLGAACWQSNKLVLTEENMAQLQAQAEAFLAFLQ